MPNFELSDEHKSSLRLACRSLCEVRTLTIELGFPLSQHDIEQGMLPASMRALFNELKKRGAESLRDTNTPVIFFGGPGIPRPAAIQLFGLKRLWFAYQLQIEPGAAELQIKRPEPNPTVDKQMFFDNNVLAPETYARLVNWVNAAVQEHRQAALTKNVVESFLNFAPTIGHLIARWPGLTLLFDEMDRSGYKGRRAHSWRERVRLLPANKNRWDWPVVGDPADWHAKHKRIIAVCDEMLVGAAMMKRPTVSGVRAHLTGWRRLAGEKL